MTALLDRWIAEAMAEDHDRGVTHGAGISSTGAIWCFECWMKFASKPTQGTQNAPS